MKGLVIRGAGDVVLMDDLPMPKLGINETLIKVKYAGICGSDIHPYRTGTKLQSGGKPYVLGHEFVGTVVDSVDDGKTLFKAGDFVTARPFFSCGICHACMSGRQSICHNFKVMTVIEGGNGTYAEYVKVPSKGIYPFQPGIDPKIAAMAEPLAVAVFDVRMSGLKGGQSVLISGGGTIGAAIGIFSRYCGASSIIFSEVNENRIKFLNQLGFAAFNPLRDNVLEKARAFNDGQLFDVVFEVSGAQESYDLCFGAVTRGGTFLPVGVTSTPRSVDMRRITVDQIKIQGVNCYEDIDFFNSVKLINHGVFDQYLEKFITDIFPLDAAKEAYLHAMSPDGSQVKVLIDCE
jgi:threonine dehydrogenase-like Zn-dependent dehydrogenase